MREVHVDEALLAVVPSRAKYQACCVPSAGQKTKKVGLKIIANRRSQGVLSRPPERHVGDKLFYDNHRTKSIHICCAVPCTPCAAVEPGVK